MKKEKSRTAFIPKRTHKRERKHKHTHKQSRFNTMGKRFFYQYWQKVEHFNSQNLKFERKKVNPLNNGRHSCFSGVFFSLFLQKKQSGQHENGLQNLNKMNLNHIYRTSVKTSYHSEYKEEEDEEEERRDERKNRATKLNWQEAKMEKINGQKFTRKRPSDRQGKNTSKLTHTHTPTNIYI